MFLSGSLAASCREVSIHVKSVLIVLSEVKIGREV